VAFPRGRAGVQRRATDVSDSDGLTSTSATFLDITTSTVRNRPLKRTPRTPHKAHTHQLESPTHTQQHHGRQQDADHAPGAAGSRHAERAHAGRGTSSCPLPRVFFNRTPVLTRLETQRTLLRALRPQARHQPVERRRGLLQELHGEVHERLEHRQQAVRRADTAGERGGRAEPVNLQR
jgi:hypothetical protein